MADRHAWECSSDELARYGIELVGWVVDEPAEPWSTVFVDPDMETAYPVYRVREPQETPIGSIEETVRD